MEGLTRSAHQGMRKYSVPTSVQVYEVWRPPDVLELAANSLHVYPVCDSDLLISWSVTSSYSFIVCFGPFNFRSKSVQIRVSQQRMLRGFADLLGDAIICLCGGVD